MWASRDKGGYHTSDSKNSGVFPLSLIFINFYYLQITSRGSQLRGELKSKTRPLVEGFFGFESGLNRKIIAKNRETAENLKDGKGFIYKVDLFLLIHLR